MICHSSRAVYWILVIVAILVMGTDEWIFEKVKDVMPLVGAVLLGVTVGWLCGIRTGITIGWQRGKEGLNKWGE